MVLNHQDGVRLPDWEPLRKAKDAMLFKLPKFVQICSIKVQVIQDPTRVDGEYDCHEKIMTIGTSSPAQVPEIFAHEILEAILYERGHRFSLYSEGNDQLRFVLDHHEFENFVKDVLVAFPNLIKH